MKNKKLVFILFMAVSIIAIISVFLILHYKNEKSGNTIINKSEEDIVESILNIKSYRAKIEIEVETNKNKTQYVVFQSLEDKKAKQEILEPSNIAGVVTEYDGTNLKIRNNKLDLETTFQNYQYIVENSLWLDSFIEEYKKENANENKNTKINVNIQENEIILEIKNDENPYKAYKKLYIDKKTGKPTKMIVQDINKKTLVYILYTEITILK